MARSMTKRIALEQARPRAPARLASPSPLALASMSAAERIAEIAEILAVGLMRVRARNASRKSADCGESSLDRTAYQSGHASP
jgi:hypothetical protein